MARGIIFHSTGTLPSGTPLLRGELPVAGFMVLAPPSRNLVIASDQPERGNPHQKETAQICGAGLSPRIRRSPRSNTTPSR